MPDSTHDVAPRHQPEGLAPLTLRVIAALVIPIAACFPDLPPISDANDDIPGEDAAQSETATSVDGSDDLVAPGDAQPGDVSVADVPGDTEAPPDGVDSDAVAPILGNLPASAEAGWGRGGTFQVEWAGPGAPGFTLRDVTCSFGVSTTAGGLVSWTCPSATERCEATVVATLDGLQETGLLSISCVNTAPAISAVRVSPTDPIPGDALECAVDGFDDADGDPDRSLVVWFLNGSPAPTGDSPVAGQVGDVWSCEVTPFDGLETGVMVASPPVEVQSRFQDVAVGHEHACAVHRRGKVYCWGANERGQLGNLSTSPSDAPVEVTVLEDALAVTAGGAHTCALRNDRSVMCWGANARGEAGTTDRTTDRLFPVAVSNLGADVTEVVAGRNHTCALKAGKVWCWGSNDKAQLARPLDVTFSREPTPIDGLPANITDIDTIEDLTCALGEGQTWCWGQSDVGAPYSDHAEPGYDTYRVLHSAPTRFDTFPPTVTELLVTDGWRICGRTPEAVLCDNTNPSHVYPSTNLFGHVAAPSLFREASSEFGTGLRRVDLPEMNEIAQLDAGDAICARWDDGRIRCFGNDGQALLGTTSRTLHSHLAEPVPLAGPATALAVGAHRTCVIAGNDVHCWGRTRRRATEAADLRNVGPVTVQGLTSPRVLSLGHHHACAITADDTLHCWGRNDYNQLADYSNSSFSVPVEIIVDVTSVSAFGERTLVLRQGATTLFGGGYDDFTWFPAPGYGAPVVEPLTWSRVVMTGPAAAWAPFSEHHCGISFVPGQPQKRLESNCTLPSQVQILSQADYDCDLAAQRCALGRFSETHVCLMDDYSEVFCDDQSPGFQNVPYGSGTHLATARGVVCLVADGALHCFGRNNAGQLGRGVTSSTVQGPGRATAISGNVTHASLSDEYGCAVVDGDVYCWGLNKGGRLGHALTSLSQTITPRKIEGLGGTAVRVVTSQPNGTFSCALLDDGRVQCWGDNLWGQLGNGEAAYQRGPVSIPFP